MLTLGSLFDGIGGWQMAAIHNGVKPIWSSEIEKFPLALTKVRFPETIQLGDVTKIDGAKIPPVDIICSGSPCQSLSVAGKREGLKGESGLFFYTTDIIRRMREATNGKYPRFLVWENVPGALNSSGGNDYRAVLEAVAETEIPIPEGGKWANAGLVQCDRCEIAWRVLDAQYFGLAQRRARVFLVADFAESDRRAGKILLVEPSGGGDSTQSEGTGQTVAGSTSDSIGNAGEPTAYGLVTKGNGDAFLNDKTHTALNCGGGQAGQGYPCVMVRDRAGKPGGGKGPLLSVERSLTIQANTNDQVLFDNQERNTVYDMHHAQDVIRTYKNQSPSLISRMGTGGNNVPIVLNDQGGSVMNVEQDDKVGTLRAEAHGNNPIVFEPGVATRDGGHIYTDDKAPTLRANPGDNFPTVACAAAFKPEQGATARGLGYAEEQSPTLTGNTPAVVYGICSKDSNSMKSGNPHSGIYEADKVRTLDTGGANPNRNQGGNVVVYALEGNGSRPSHRGDGWSETETMYTLNTVDRHAVAYGIDQQGGKGGANYTVDIAPTLCADSHGTPHAVAQPKPIVWATSKASFFTNFTEEKAQTLLATDWKDAPRIITKEDQVETDEEDV